jgi:predicted component of viral defense system (DUF524 family)
MFPLNNAILLKGMGTRELMQYAIRRTKRLKLGFGVFTTTVTA